MPILVSVTILGSSTLLILVKYVLTPRHRVQSYICICMAIWSNLYLYCNIILQCCNGHVKYSASVSSEMQILILYSYPYQCILILKKRRPCKTIPGGKINQEGGNRDAVRLVCFMYTENRFHIKSAYLHRRRLYDSSDLTKAVTPILQEIVRHKVTVCIFHDGFSSRIEIRTDDMPLWCSWCCKTDRRHRAKEISNR